MSAKPSGSHQGHPVARCSLRAAEGSLAAHAVSRPDGRQEGAHGPHEASRPSSHQASPDSPEQGVRERFRRRFARLGALHAQMAQICRDLAEDPEIQLAGMAEQSVHATPPEGAGMDLEADEAATATQPGRLLDVAGLAEVLCVAPRTVRRWRGSGKLPPAIDVGGLLRWRREDVDRWLEERREAAP